MNRDDIIRIARKAGDFLEPVTESDAACLERFAELIAAAERAACAKVADKWPDYDVQGLAEAIRVRGDK